MSVFETATQEVRSIHNENTLRRLEYVSADYYWAQEEIKELKELLAKTLPVEEMKKIEQLHDKFKLQEGIAGEIYYNQAFSDAIRFIIQSLTWGPVRR